MVRKSAGSKSRLFGRSGIAYQRSVQESDYSCFLNRMLSMVLLEKLLRVIRDMPNFLGFLRKWCVSWANVLSMWLHQDKLLMAFTPRSLKLSIMCNLIILILNGACIPSHIFVDEHFLGLADIQREVIILAPGY